MASSATPSSLRSGRAKILFISHICHMQNARRIKGHETRPVKIVGCQDPYVKPGRQVEAEILGHMSELVRDRYGDRLQLHLGPRGWLEGARWLSVMCGVVGLCFSGPQ